MKLYQEGAERYFAEAQLLRSPKSEVTYGKVMRLCQATRPSYELGDWSSHELAEFCTSRNAADGTVRHRRGVLSAFWSWALWRGLTDSNPAADLKFILKPGRAQTRRGNWLTDDEVLRIYRSFDVTDELQHRDRVLFALGLYTGLRVGALSELTWDKFTADLAWLRVKVKGAKLLDIPVNEQLRAELEPWRELALGPVVLPSFRWEWSLAGRVRVADWDTPLGDSGIWGAVKRAGQAIGKPQLAPHDLRRSYAGWLQDSGVEPKTIQDLMGHASIQTTYDVYLERNPARLSRAMNGLRREL